MVSGATRSIGVVAAIASAIVFLLLLVLFDQCFEPVESGGPELLPLPEPFLGFLEPFGLECADLLAARFPPLDKAGAFEHLHVLGCAGEGHVERLAKLADRLLAERPAGRPPGP